MGLDDMFNRESAFVAAATAAVFSPRTRETVRRGAVLGVAGALRAGDVVAGAARGVVRGVREETSNSGGAGSSSRAGSGARSGASRGGSSGTRRSSGSGSGASRSKSTGSRGTRGTSGSSASK